VVHVGNCVKIDEKIPLEEICLLACGVPTGESNFLSKIFFVKTSLI
jgi:Zn-dependent alcohol dehydrogenase